MAAEGRLFIIGAQRSGTTLLWQLLQAHPQIQMAPVHPEPKFFLRDDVDAHDTSTYDEEVFGARQAFTSVRGEKSTTYLERPRVAARIANCFDGAHVVAVLRDPVERALSNYRFSRQHGFETWSLKCAMTDAGEGRAWPRDQLSASPFHHRRRGLYAQLLAPWKAQFGERLHLIEHASVTRPAAALSRLVALMGLEPHPWPEVPEPVNASQKVRLPEEAEVRADLSRFFMEPNRELERGFGIDTSAWA